MEIITGPMKSGKSHRLIERVSSLSENKNVYVFYCQTDTRTPNRITSRTGKSMKAIPVATIDQIAEHLPDDDSDLSNLIIAVDECQFLPSGGWDILRKYEKAMWLLSGLDKDAFGKPFGVWLKEASQCDCRTEFLTANCDFCEETENATETVLLNKRESMANSNILVGDTEYSPCCPSCLQKESISRLRNKL